jgi:hypothetical protein
VSSSPARANVGRQWWGGYASEPTGGLKDIAISRETLDIDLRPLAKGQAVRVEATYHLHNFGSRQRLHLVFVAGSKELKEFVVCLDERPLTTEKVPTEMVSHHWDSKPAALESSQPLSASNHPQLPQFNPSAMQSAVHIGGNWYPMSLVTFTVEIPPGPSTLRASYRTKAVGTDEGYPTATWHLPYVLSPARAWRSFGGLDVLVHLPDGWEHLSTPPLERNGNELRGSFTGLPADELVVSTRLPLGPEHQRRIIWFTVTYFVMVVAGGVLCGAWGRFVGKRLWRSAKHRAIRAALFLSIGMSGLAWGALVFGAWQLTSWGIRGPIALQEAPYYHGHFSLPACASFLFSVLAIPLGMVLTGEIAAAYRKRGISNKISGMGLPH